MNIESTPKKTNDKLRLQAFLRSIAWKVRRRCEKYVNKESTYFDSDLSMMCAIASHIIHELLNKKGIDSQLIYGEYIVGPGIHEKCQTFTYGEGHCWVECHGYIVDVTATQFDAVPKVIVRINDGTWKPQTVIDEKFDWYSWDETQVPSHDKFEKIAGDLL